MIQPAPIDPPEIHDKLWEDISGYCAYDIGANTGQSLPDISKKFLFVEAYEPAEECWSSLSLNAREFGNVQVYNLAISDHDGYVDLIEIPSKIKTGQLVSDTPSMEWSHELYGSKSLIRRVACSTVDTQANKENAPSPDFMKIDVEGHELRVLRGARQILMHEHPSLLIEIHSHFIGIKCEDELRFAGYDNIELIRHPHYSSKDILYYEHYWIKAL